jgi:hypothetical protein
VVVAYLTVYTPISARSASSEVRSQARRSHSTRADSLTPVCSEWRTHVLVHHNSASGVENLYTQGCSAAWQGALLRRLYGIARK